MLLAAGLTDGIAHQSSRTRVFMLNEASRDLVLTALGQGGF
jgi:hypothetical protein